MTDRTLTQTKTTAPTFVPVNSGVLQRSAVSNQPVNGVPSIVGDVLRSSGQAFDPASRAFMASRFGHDFSQIPVHAKTPARLQTKLAVNTPGDIYEQEADTVADKVMRMATPAASSVQRQTEEGKLVQRKTTGGADVQTAPPIVDEVLRSPGHPLDADTKAFMEPRFGHDFSQVRVHADTSAAASARAICAKAYTVGHDVVFGDGRFAPETIRGRHLLAHELAHVVQQQRGGDAPSSSTGSTHEPFARDAADDLIRGNGPVQVAGGTAIGLARDVDTVEAQRIADLRKRLDAAIADERWKDVAMQLNAFVPTDIEETLARLKPHQIAVIYEYASSRLGEDSRSARATHWAFVDREFGKAVAGSQWGWAALYLNGMSPDDILTRIRRLDTASVQSLHDGAAKEPNVVRLSAQVLEDRKKAPPEGQDVKGEQIIYSLDQGLIRGDRDAVAAAEALAQFLFKKSVGPSGEVNVSVARSDETRLCAGLGITAASLTRIEGLVRTYGPKAHRLYMDYAGRQGTAQNLAEREQTAKLDVVLNPGSTLGGLLATVSSMRGGTAEGMRHWADLGSSIEGVAGGLTVGKSVQHTKGPAVAGGVAKRPTRPDPAPPTGPAPKTSSNFVTVPVSPQVPDPSNAGPVVVRFAPAPVITPMAPKAAGPVGGEKPVDHAPWPAPATEGWKLHAVAAGFRRLARSDRTERQRAEGAGSAGPVLSRIHHAATGNDGPRSAGPRTRSHRGQAHDESRKTKGRLTASGDDNRV